jgi:hypothetical protein
MNKEQIEEYIHYAELEAGPTCTEDWFLEISNKLRELNKNNYNPCIYCGNGIVNTGKSCRYIYCGSHRCDS